jgi:hypothetical protein
MWNEPGFPHKGWTAVNAYDLGEGNNKPCDMGCGATPRFIHVLKHPEYGKQVNVGSMCAGNLTDDYVGAKAREKTIRLKAEEQKRQRDRDEERKAEFFRPWMLAKSGKSWFKKFGRWVAIGIKGYHGYTVIAKVSGDTSGDGKSFGPFSTPTEAKTAAFNFLKETR